MLRSIQTELIVKTPLQDGDFGDSEKMTEEYVFSKCVWPFVFMSVRVFWCVPELDVLLPTLFL